MFLSALSVQAHHWKKRRALAMGIVLTGSSFGGIIHPVVHSQLFHGRTGFTWGVRASAFLISRGSELHHDYPAPTETRRS